MMMWVILTILTAWVGPPAGAEVILRKDGQKIEGQIVREDATYLIIQTAYGTFRINKDQIESISGRRAISQNEREGRDAMAAGDFDRALAKFQAALKDATKPEERAAIDALIAEANKRIQQREESRFADQLKSVNRLIDEKRFADAQTELDNLLKRNPEPSPAARVIRQHMADLRMKEAAYYEDQINFAEAGDAYQRAIDLIPDNPQPYFKMARLIQRRGGKDSDAIDYYTRGLERAMRTRKESEMLDIYYELGKTYLRAAIPAGAKEPNQKYLMEGIKDLLIVSRDGATSYPFVASQLDKGFVQLSKTTYDADAMIKMILSTLEVNPKAQKPRWILADVYGKKHEYDKAIEQLLKIESDTKAGGEALPEELYYRLGLAYLALPKPDYDKALAAFEKEIQQNKMNYMALIKAAEIHSINGAYEDALKYCDQAIALRKERPEAYLVAGEAYMRSNQPGDTQQARSYLTRALNLKADFHLARIKLAEIEIMQQRKAETPDYAQAAILLGQVMAGIDAIDKTKLTDDDHKAKADAILLMAEVEFDRKNNREAFSTLKEALKEYPNFASAYRLQGQIQVALEAYDEAKKSYLRAIELEPRTPETYRLLGILCQNYLKSYNEAIKYYKDYLENKGSEVETVNRWIGECTRAVGGGPLTTSSTTETVKTAPGSVLPTSATAAKP